MTADNEPVTRVFAGSRVLARGEYDPATMTLRLWFKSTPLRAHEFRGVPLAIWHGLCAAPSAGGYFGKFIRRQYGSRAT